MSLRVNWALQPMLCIRLWATRRGHDEIRHDVCTCKNRVSKTDQKGTTQHCVCRIVQSRMGKMYVWIGQIDRWIDSRRVHWLDVRARLFISTPLLHLSRNVQSHAVGLRSVLLSQKERASLASLARARCSLNEPGAPLRGNKHESRKAGE